MPVVQLDYVAKGAAHTKVTPTQDTSARRVAEAGGNTNHNDYRPTTDRQRNALIDAMRAAMESGAIQGISRPLDIRQVLADNSIRDTLADEDGRFVRAVQAADAITDYTRTRMREESFMRRIMPPLTITNDELDRAIPTDRPMKIVDTRPMASDDVESSTVAKSQGRRLIRD